MSETETETQTTEPEPKPAATPKVKEDHSLREVRQAMVNKAYDIAGKVTSPASDDKTSKATATADVLRSLVQSITSITAQDIQLDKALTPEKPKAEKKAKKQKKAK